MSKMRIHEYAKQKNVTSREVIDHLKKLEIEVGNHMTMISENEIKQLDQQYDKKDEKKKTKKQKPKNDKKKKQHRSKGKQSQSNEQTAPKNKKSASDKPEKITYHGRLTVEDLAEK